MVRKVEGSGDLPELTPREKAVLDLLVEGYGKVQVALRLQIGERTVDRVLNQLAEKFREIDPLLIETRGTVGRIARIVALYTAHRQVAQAEKGFEFVPGGPLLRLAVHSEIEVGFEQTDNETEIRVECLENEVALTSHGIIIDDHSPEVSVLPQRLEVGTPSSRIKVRQRLIVEDEKRPLFQVLFDPPLTRGQQLSYYYYLTHPTYFPMSLEQLAKRFKAKSYEMGEIKEQLCEKSYTISTPTKRLYLRLTFPPYFEIENEQIRVEVGRGGPVDRAEEKRIEKTGAFFKRVFGRRSSLILELDNPVLLRRYRLRWRPMK
jgi:hypothetical protein